MRADHEATRAAAQTRSTELAASVAALGVVQEGLRQRLDEGLGRLAMMGGGAAASSSSSPPRSLLRSTRPVEVFEQQLRATSHAPTASVDVRPPTAPTTHHPSSARTSVTVSTTCAFSQLARPPYPYAAQMSQFQSAAAMVRSMPFKGLESTATSFLHPPREAPPVFSTPKLSPRRPGSGPFRPGFTTPTTSSSYYQSPW